MTETSRLYPLVVGIATWLGISIGDFLDTGAWNWTAGLLGGAIMTVFWAWVMSRSKAVKEAREAELKKRLATYEPREAATWTDLNIPLVGGALLFVSITMAGVSMGFALIAAVLFAAFLQFSGLLPRLTEGAE